MSRLRSATKRCEDCSADIFEGRIGLRRYCTECAERREVMNRRNQYKRNREYERAQMKVLYWRKRVEELRPR